MIDLRILGPVEVWMGGDGPVRIGGPRPASILATFALARDATVSHDRLIDDVWGADPPRRARDTLQSHLSRLRRVLEPERAAHQRGEVLVRAPGGYRLGDGVITDAARFEAAVAAANDALAAGSPERAGERLRDGLALWRGPVAQGLELGTATRAAATRLEELRLTAVEGRIQADLAVGRHAELVGELEALVAEYPVRERLQALWMVALYRSGRHAEALDAFRHARERLVELLGVEPSPRLVELHERMLSHDLPPAPEGTAAPPVEGTGTSIESPGNLPAPLGELIGRDTERERVAAALRANRLLTLTGAGGCGKTQLALQVARDVAAEHPGGVWLVELESLANGALVAPAIAEVLGVDDADPDVLLADLIARLSHAPALLVLDNCEHLVNACATLVRALLLACGQLSVLATSRQPLDLDGEVAWRVPSLTVPAPDADLETLRASDAVRLFERRAAAAREDFVLDEDDVPHVGAICRELDGIPLAIELAAARMRVLSPEEVAARLDDRFAVLRSSRRGAPPRHRTLEAAIAWSHELLDPPARRLLSRLSVFVGGFTVDAVEATCSGDDLPASDVLDLLQGLVDRSLVATSSATVGPARHHLLQTVRSYAGSQLGRDERTVLAARHAAWVAGLADEAGPRLTGSDQVRWLNRLHVEQDNLRAALTWALASDRTDLAIRIAVGVWWFWLQFGHAREGARWFGQILDRLADRGVDPAAMQQVTFATGMLLSVQGDTSRARAHLERSIELADAVGRLDRRSLAEGRLAEVLEAERDRRAAHEMLETARATAAQVEDAWVDATLADVAGHLAWSEGALDAASGAYRTSERCYLEAGDRWSACLSRLGAATVAHAGGRHAEALRLHQQNLRAIGALTRSELDFVGFARDLRGVAALCSAAGRHEEAAQLVGASERIRTLGQLPLTPDERDEVEAVLHRARRTAGAGPVDRALAEGRSLQPSDALQAALEGCALLAGAA